MTRAVRRQGGFTVIEVLISVAVLMLGLAGVMAIQSTVVKGSRDSRRLDRAKLIAEETMEEARSTPLTTMIVPTTITLPDYVASDGVTYHRRLIFTQVPGQANLILMDVEISFAEEGDEADLRFARSQMIRTRQELL